MLDIAQTHDLIGKQLQRPALSPIRGLATGQMNQVGFSFAIQTAAFGAFSGKTSSESHLQALLDKSLFDADHGAATNRERFGNLPIGVTGVPLTLIAHQEHSGDEIVFGRCPTHLPHRFQKMALLLTRAYWIGVVMGSHT